MEDHFSFDIAKFERVHQMWSFLRDLYEPIGHCTFLAAIHQEQLLRQGDATIDAFFDQFSAILSHPIFKLKPNAHSMCAQEQIFTHNIQKMDTE
jgi:hypothetical protein